MRVTKFIILIFISATFCFPEQELSAAKGRVSNGVPANLGDFPFFALLEYLGTPWCGGSFIKFNYVLTVAHCIEDNIQQYKIYGGVVKANPVVDAKFETTVTFDDYIRHDLWNSATSENDIGLIYMRHVSNDASIFDGTYVAPIALPVASDAQNSFEGYTMRAIGFGLKNNTHASDVLLSGDTTVITNTACLQAHVNSPFPIRTSNICVSTSHLVGPCQGDSGGAGRVRRGGEYIVLGVVSWGVAACPSGQPVVHTRVTSYLSWINAEITRERGSSF